MNSRSCCGGGAAYPSSCPPLAASARASLAALVARQIGAHTTHPHMPACLSCWLAGYTVRAKHTHRNSCHLLDTREARVSHAPHAHSCSLKEAQVRAAKPPKPPVAPAVHPLRSRDGAGAAAAAAALRRSPRTCRCGALYTQQVVGHSVVTPPVVQNQRFSATTFERFCVFVTLCEN